MVGVNIGVAAPVAFFPFSGLEGLLPRRPARPRPRRGRVLHAQEDRHLPLVLERPGHRQLLRREVGVGGTGLPWPFGRRRSRRCAAGAPRRESRAGAAAGGRREGLRASTRQETASALSTASGVRPTRSTSDGVEAPTRQESPVPAHSPLDAPPSMPCPRAAASRRDPRPSETDERLPSALRGRGRGRDAGRAGRRSRRAERGSPRTRARAAARPRSRSTSRGLLGADERDADAGAPGAAGAADAVHVAVAVLRRVEVDDVRDARRRRCRGRRRRWRRACRRRPASKLRQSASRAGAGTCRRASRRPRRPRCSGA